MKPPLKIIDLELSRTIAAAPAEVFDAWLDPTCPGTAWSVASRLVLDPKVDGLYYWLFVNAAGEEKPHYGRFTILDRPSKVQYTWMSRHTQGLESLVTVTFQENGDNTVMTLRHENLPDDEFGRGHEPGWNSLLGAFADAIQVQRGQA